MTNQSAAFEREYYAANYRNYDRQNPERKLAHYRQAVTRYARPSAEPSILDIGCAFGKFLASMDRPWKITGIDYSEYAISIAREQVGRGRFAVVRDGRIPFAEPFAAITAWDVIEHIPDLDAVANEVNTHLSDDGVFVFVVPVYDGPIGPVVRLLDGDPTHVHRMPRRFWLDWARRYFVVEDWWGIFRYLLPTGHYVHRPTHTLRGVAPAVAVVARRRAACR